MADTLILRKGLLANLAAAPKIAGAISITTDERAMYVDLDNETRIRLGDFIEVDTYEDLIALKDEWKTTGFYYVKDINGLYKYSDVEGWKLVNEKSDFSGDISSLQTTVAGHGTDIAGLKTDVAANTKAISDEAARADAAEKVNAAAVVTEKERAEGAERALGERIDGVNTSISGVASDLAAEVTRAKAAEKANADNITALQTGKQDSITGAATSVVANDLTASKVLVSDINGKIAVNALDASKLAYLSDVTGNIQSQIDSANTANSDLATTVANLDKAYKAADSGFETRIKALEDAEEKATAAALEQLERDYKAADVTINEKITALQNKDTGFDTTIADIQTDITELETAVGNLETDISDGDAATLQSAKDYADGKVGAEAEARTQAINNLQSGYENADTAIRTSISEVSTAVSTEKTRAEGQEAAIRSEFAAADAALKTEVTNAYKEYVDGKLQAADAMRFMGVIDDSEAFEDQIVTPVEAGHTYKVGAEIIIDGATRRVGDLVIANADQEGETYTGGWSFVSSGYEDDYDPSLVGDAAAKSVTLKSGVDADLGKLVFADAFDASAEKHNGGMQYVVTVSGDTTTVTAQMVWGEF